MVVMRGFTAGWPQLTTWAHPSAKLTLSAVAVLAGMPAPAAVDPELTRPLSLHLLQAAGQVCHITQEVAPILFPVNLAANLRVVLHVHITLDLQPRANLAEG